VSPYVATADVSIDPNSSSARWRLGDAARPALCTAWRYASVGVGHGCERDVLDAVAVLRVMPSVDPPLYSRSAHVTTTRMSP